jgi:hypothetical protein
VTDGGGERAPSHQRGWGPPQGVPSVHRRPDYPLVGCAPAEPASVSPGVVKLPAEQSRNKLNRQRSDNGSGPGRPETGVAKDRRFLV